MEELLDKVDCADYDQLFQRILQSLDEDLSDLEYMIVNDSYSEKEICNKIVEIRRMII